MSSPPLKGGNLTCVCLQSSHVFVSSRDDRVKQCTIKLVCVCQADEKRDHVEVSAEGGVIVQQLARRIIEDGGAALIIDYGHNGTKTDTFRVRHTHQARLLKLPVSHMFKVSQIKTSKSAYCKKSSVTAMDCASVKWNCGAHVGIVQWGVCGARRAALT